MEFISTEMLEEGNTIAKDVHSSSNMLLLPAGTILTSSQINMLKTWGVRRIFIDINEDTESPEYKKIEKDLDQKVNALFLHNKKSEFINSLKLAIRRPLRRKLRGKS
jgi:hypothetical protein